jgi:pseudoazurin
VTKNNPLKLVKFSLAAALFGVSLGVYAAEHEVKMLNNGADGIMVFEPGYLKIEKGDTVKFVATDAGHNAVSEVMPDGQSAWEVGYEGGSVTFNQEGVNIYYCLPHKSMGMYGVIQVGNATNLEDAKAKGAGIAGAMAMNGDRIDKYLSQAK